MGERSATDREIILALAGDRESGAAEIARRAGEALSALPRTALLTAVETLVRGHPSMAPLWRLGSALLAARDHRPVARECGRAMAEETRSVAARATPLLEGEILVHSYSSTAVEALASAGRAGASRVLCARSEPGGEGARMAGALHERGIEAEVLDDREALQAACDVSAVVVGADAITPATLVNKVGTGALAAAAGRAGVPVYALAGGFKFVGADLPAPLPFERIALEALCGVVTQEGVLKSTAAAFRASGHPLYPALVPLLHQLSYSSRSGR